MALLNLILFSFLLFYVGPWRNIVCIAAWLIRIRIIRLFGDFIITCLLEQMLLWLQHWMPYWHLILFILLSLSWPMNKQWCWLFFNGSDHQRYWPWWSTCRLPCFVLEAQVLIGCSSTDRRMWLILYGWNQRLMSWQVRWTFGLFLQLLNISAFTVKLQC